MTTHSFPDPDIDDIVSFKIPIVFWVLLSIYVIAALYLLCSLTLTTLFIYINLTNIQLKCECPCFSEVLFSKIQGEVKGHFSSFKGPEMKGNQILTDVGSLICPN